MKRHILIPILICVFVVSLLCACSNAVDFKFPKYTVAKQPATSEPLAKDEGAVVDGVLDEPFWKDAEKTAFTIVSKVSEDVTMTTMAYVSDFGVYFGIVVNDYAVYYNSERAASRNTSAEIYVRGSATAKRKHTTFVLRPRALTAKYKKNLVHGG